eukprot:SAG31_NODE_4312_length_3366_cov_245.528926_4_plen_91_part_00
MALPELLEQEIAAFDITRVRHRRYPVRYGSVFLRPGLSSTESTTILSIRTLPLRTGTYRYVLNLYFEVLVNLERETGTPATSTCDVHAGS